MAGGTMGINARFEYLQAMQELYRDADDTSKTRMLDEMEKITRQTRKHLIYQMNRSDLYRHRRSRERDRTYGDDVEAAMIVIADTLDWICAPRLQPTLQRTAQDLIRFGELDVSPSVLEKLGTISVPTVQRMLSRIRPKERLPRAYPGRHPETQAQQAVPESIIDWKETETGHFEVDLVHHGVIDQDGKLICTIQFIDVLTGWSERFAIMGYTFDTMWQAMQTFREHCPMPVRELHSDNGSEFINMALISTFGQEMVQARQTRGRPQHSNDNRHVEQKNSSLVRAYLGYVHLHTYQQLEALSDLYNDMWLYYNFFQPVLRQIERTAVKGKDNIVHVKRCQDRARTPCERLLKAKPPLSRKTKQHLIELRQQTNPLALKRQIHAKIAALIALAEGGCYDR